MSIAIKINGSGDAYTTMSDALSNAQDGDVINITMADGDILTSADGANGAGKAVDYVISGGTASGNKGVAGGVISLGGATATLTADDVLFDGNTASRSTVAWTGGGALSTGTDMGALAGLKNTITLSNSTFSNNAADHGGAINCYSNLVVTNSEFNYNYASGDRGGGALFLRQNGTPQRNFSGVSFTGNTARTFGGAIYNYLGAGLKINGYTDPETKAVIRSSFTNNVAANNDGGCIYIVYGVANIADTDFSGNTAKKNGGAIFLSSNGGMSSVTNTVFSGNTAYGNGGAIYNEYNKQTGFSISGGVYFLTASDTIYNTGIVTITNTNYFNASVLGTGTFNVKNSTMVFGNTVGIDIAGLTFSGKNTMIFGGDAAVNFGGQDLSAVTITIDNTDFIPGETITVATGVTKVGTVNSLYYGDKFTWSLTDGTLTCSTADPGVRIALSGSEKTYYTMAAVLKDAKNGDTVTVTMNDGDIISGGVDTNGAGKAVNYVVSGGTVANNTGVAGAFVQLCGTNSKFTATDVLFANNTGTDCVTGWMGGGAISSGTNMANAKKTVITLNDCVFTGNYSADHGGAAHLMGSFYITGSEFNNNRSSERGGALFVRQNDTTVRKMSGVSFVGNTAGTFGGAIYNYLGNGLTVDGTAGRNTFTDNAAKNDGGAYFALYGGATFSAVDFTGNKAVNGGALYFDSGYDSDHICVVSDAVFTNNTATGNGGAIYNKHTSGLKIENSAFMTASDTIYNLSTVTFSGNITLNASLLGTGTYTVVDGANFTIGQGVDLNGLDLSNATVTVNSALYTGSEVTVATGVAAIGAYTLDNKELMLSVSDNKLILSKMAEIALNDEKTVTGTESNLIASGSAETFIANKTAAAENLLTTIKGGAISNALVGGAYAKFAEVGKAVIGKVELNISDLADVAGKVYAGGYLYGNNSDSAEAQMEVAEVNVTLDGGKVSTNMFGGAHAREYGNANIETVNITVTDGIHGRIYAGGWAEKGAESHVGTSNVIISGGTVDYLYGAGANADGETFVGTSNITIENDAVVNTIFMGGRYGYSYVNTVNLTFAGENKELTRLSGVSSAGMDYANATVVELATDATADLIDYVDKFVINEDCTLTANNEFYLGDRNNETGATEDFTTFDFIADGEANWTAVAGISDFTNAKFSVNGAGLTTWDGKAALAIGGYSLTYDAKDKTIKLAQITA